MLPLPFRIPPASRSLRVVDITRQQVKQIKLALQWLHEAPRRSFVYKRPLWTDRPHLVDKPQKSPS